MLNMSHHVRAQAVRASDRIRWQGLQETGHERRDRGTGRPYRRTPKREELSCRTDQFGDVVPYTLATQRGERDTADGCRSQQRGPHPQGFGQEIPTRPCTASGNRQRY